MRSMFIIRAALTGLLMFALVLPANAQDGSVAINGTVKSSAGAGLGGVAILLSGPTSAQQTPARQFLTERCAGHLHDHGNEIRLQPSDARRCRDFCRTNGCDRFRSRALI